MTLPPLSSSVPSIRRSTLFSWRLQSVFPELEESQLPLRPFIHSLIHAFTDIEPLPEPGRRHIQGADKIRCGSSHSSGRQRAVMDNELIWNQDLIWSPQLTDGMTSGKLSNLSEPPFTYFYQSFPRVALKSGVIVSEQPAWC